MIDARANHRRPPDDDCFKPKFNGAAVNTRGKTSEFNIAFETIRGVKTKLDLSR